MPYPSTRHVFMSYSRRDEAVMRRVVAFLRRQGINVWLDNEKLVPGTPIWEEEIEKAIKLAGAIVVIMSPDSKKSEWVRREISLAEQYNQRVFPILINGNEDSAITIRLITKQFIDLRKNEDAGLESLATNLNSYLHAEEIDDISAKRIQGKSSNKNTSKFQKFISTWYGRILIGAIAGLFSGLVMALDQYGYYAINITVFGVLMAVGAFSGLITAPKKYSFIFWVSGLIIIGTIFEVFQLNGAGGLNEFIGSGFFFGVPLGAIFARILYWAKY
jgi:hypothetical protein